MIRRRALAGTLAGSSLVLRQPGAGERESEHRPQRAAATRSSFLGCFKGWSIDFDRQMLVLQEQRQ